jgi:dihydrolipoamide dehydrogenase
VVAGDARIETATRITVEEGDSSRAFDVGKIILATGSSPARLDFPGVEHTLNSTEALSLDHPPESMVIIGAGAIGVEFAVIFGSFGTKVTLVELMDSVLPFEDKEITHLLTKSLEKSGITVLTSSTMSSVEKKAEGLQSRVTGPSGEREIRSEAVLLSVGRRPNLDACANLDLSGERGFVEVNDSMETKLPGVYAAGDVCGKFLLAYTASKEGEVAALNALDHPSRMSYEHVPRLIYSHPEVGAVGLTEEQASKEREIVVGRFPMMGNSRAYAEMEPEGMVKVVADKASGLLLGVHILGPYATELVLSPTIMLELKMTVAEAAEVTYGHPSFAETIREALLDAAGCPLHK